MRVIGEWKRSGGGQFVRQLQTQLGVLAEKVTQYADDRDVGQGRVLREIWNWVLKSDIEVSMVRLVRDFEGSERLTSVAVSQDMLDMIETVRGDIPRGTFLRAITAAGLNQMKESNNETDNRG